MPTSTTVLLSKAINCGLDESDRAKLSPSLLAQLAVGGYITLTPSDRRRLPRTTLALLAIGGFIELSRYERDSFHAHTLALLAVSGRTTLHASELVRLPTDLQSIVKKQTAMMPKAAQKPQVDEQLLPVVKIDDGSLCFYNVSDVLAAGDR